MIRSRLFQRIGKGSCLFFLAVVLAAGCCAQAQEPWPPITRESRPWAYWWWMGSAVDKENIASQLSAYQQAGLGGVHIIPIYGAKGYEDRYIEFLSPRWMEMLDYTVTEAARLGMGVDMTLGTGWCFGGPKVTDEQANAVLKHAVRTVEGGQTLDKLSDPSVQAIVAYGPNGQIEDLTPRIQSDGSFEWTAPEGSWKVYEIWQKPSGRKVKRAAPGGEGHMLNPFCARAMEDYLAWFDAAFKNYKGAKPRAVYHDSYEYVCDWSPDLLAEFEKRRGYRLQNYLPRLLSDADNDTVCRVKGDYRRTVSEMMMDNFAAPWVAWSHANGFLTRNEAHGSPANLLDFYAAADMPETEFFRFDRNPLVAKFASSAGHTAGRLRISSETATWLKEHFHVTLGDLKSFIDGLFVSGINHVFYHGTCYSPADAPWPGWVFYASTQMNPRNSIWHDVDALNGYITRCQSVLQAGRPDNDILLYWPIHDLWHDCKGLVNNLTVHSVSWLEDQPVGRTAQALWNAGYAFDYVSDAQLARAKADGKTIQMPGGDYRAIVVPPYKHMPLETMQELRRLAAGGAIVIFESAMPADVPGLSNLDQQRTRLQEMFDSLTWKIEEGFIVTAQIEKGVFLRANDLRQTLAAAGVQRETMVDKEGIEYIRRADDLGHWYFITNQDRQFTGDCDTTALDDWITLARPTQSVLLMDPLTGQTGAAAIRTEAGKPVQVYLRLEPGQSLILRTFSEKQPDLPAWKYYRDAGEPTPIAGRWKVEFLRGGPDLPAPYTTDTLSSWADRDDPKAQSFAGTAKYTISFDRPAAEADAWRLDLGRVAQSARVRINGQSYPTVFAQPMSLTLPVDALKPAGNTLEVEVTNLSANRLRDLDRRGVQWAYFRDINIVNIDYKKMDAAQWPLVESGLLGPVHLIPQKDQALNAADKTELPKKADVLSAMTLANNYFMDKWPDPGKPIVTDKTRPSNIWTRGTYYEGLMALYEIDPQDRYYDYAVTWGEAHKWLPAYGDVATRHADNHCCGQTYIDLYLIDPKPERIAGIKESIDRMVASDKSDDWWWIDALQMAMPIFAKLGVIYEDDRYFEKMYDLYSYTKNSHGDHGLYNPADRLWWRDKDFDPPYTEPNGEDCYWSRGNGWVLAALARVLEIIPADVPHREEYLTNFREMADALVPLQRADGFWNVSLHDPAHFGGPELSGTAFFVYGLAWGVNSGILEGPAYLSAAVRGWNAMVADALHPNGFLGYVQGTGKEPKDGQPVTRDKAPNFEDYGLGAFLLAGSEIYKLEE